MKTYGITIQDEAYYEIEANSMEEAEAQALDYWDERMPVIETEVLTDNEELVILRANTLGGMNSYVTLLNDKNLLRMWHTVFPFDCDEEELMLMAKSEELFTDLTNTFAKILRCVG